MSKGPWVYQFTLADIARAAGVAIEEVKRAKVRKELDPHDFCRVCDWVMRRRVLERLRV